MRSMLKWVALAGLAAGLTAAAAVPASAAGGGAGGSSVAYSATATPLVGNMPSVGAEAYAFNELGDQVTLAGSHRDLSNVVVTLSSWGCVTGHWNTGDCVTPSGATFNVPITFNVYDPAISTAVLIASTTQTFAIPYRPSANSTKCTGADAGKWFDTSAKTCFNGMATNVTFNFPAGTTLPDQVVYGIAYDTSHYGYNPITDSSACPAGGCGYDSLNVGLASSPAGVTAGSDDDSDSMYINQTPSAEFATYTPAVQLKARK
jgi:hypothetical protein